MSDFMVKGIMVGTVEMAAVKYNSIIKALPSIGGNLLKREMEFP